MLECSQGKKNPPFMRFMNKEISENRTVSPAPTRHEKRKTPEVA